MITTGQRGFGFNFSWASGCDFWTDAGMDEYLIKQYAVRYGMGAPPRVLAIRRDKGYCTRATIDGFVASTPPLPGERPSSESLDTLAESSPAGPVAQPGATMPPPSTMPKWAIPAAIAGGLGVLGIIAALVLRRR